MPDRRVEVPDAAWCGSTASISTIATQPSVSQGLHSAEGAAGPRVCGPVMSASESAATGLLIIGYLIVE
jgi:hypothetical protein